MSSQASEVKLENSDIRDLENDLGFRLRNLESRGVDSNTSREPQVNNIIAADRIST
jgi:hypothetical protein